MKNTSFLKYSLTAAGCLLLLSCSRNFLERNPLDAVVQSFDTQEDAASNLVACYLPLTESYFNYFSYQRVYLEGLSDNAYHPDAYDYDNLTDIARGIVTPASGMITTIWATAYTGISACNTFLAGISSTKMNETLKNQYIGEASFLRAFYYFDLVTFYGDVVVYTTPPTLETANIPRSPKDSVLRLIDSDIATAVAGLPDNIYQGHVVRGTALALQARVALSQNQWPQVVASTKQIMSSGKFSLFPDYAGIFLKKSQPGNPEILFSTQYESPNNQQNAAYGPYYGLDIEIGKYATMCPYQELVDNYETTNGKKITDPASGYNASTPYINRDSRLLKSIKVPGNVWYNPDGTVFVPILTPPTGFQMIKYIDTTLFPIAFSDINKENEDLVQIRYADVLLMYAEATNEGTGPDASVYETLNQIRRRSGQPDVDQGTYADQTSLRNFIRHERRIELAFEGLRYFDLLRWKTADKVIPKIKNPGGASVTFDEHNYVWPIPQQEINANRSLVQNPGY